MAEHSGLEDDAGGASGGASGGATEELQGVVVTGKEVFHGFAAGELDVGHAAVAEHHDEEGKPPPRGSQLDGSGVPAAWAASPGANARLRKAGRRTGRTARTYALTMPKPPV